MASSPLSKFVIIVNSLGVLMLLLAPHHAVGCKLKNKSLEICRKKCQKKVPKGCKRVCKKCLKGTGNGEEECEGKELKKKKCLKVGCCTWENKKCWSAVGTDACEGGDGGGGGGDGGQMYGGCHIGKECSECINSPLKFVSDIKPLPSAGSSLVSMMVNGLHLVGRKSSESYVRWCWVAKVITEILNDDVADLDTQKDVIRNLYKRKVIASVTVGKRIEFKDSFADTNSICDTLYVKSEDGDNASGQISEILEHILHFIHIGERYVFSQWSTKSETSTDAWEAVQEAVDKKVYDISGYSQIPEEERRRIILQEFHFWLVFADWNVLNDGEFNLGFGEWQGVNNLKEMKEKLPKTYRLYTTTTGKVLRKPSINTIRSLGFLRQGSTPKSCIMPKLQDIK